MSQIETSPRLLRRVRSRLSLPRSCRRSRTGRPTRSSRCRRAVRRRGWPTAISTSQGTGCRTAPVRGSAAASVWIRPREGSSIPKVTPEVRPVFQPWALGKIKSMTPTEVELSKSSVNCMPRGLPAIWLQNPYSTVIVHTPKMMAQLYEVLNNWRLIHLDGRPVPEESRAVVPRHQHAALGGRHAGRRIDRVRRTDLRAAQRLVPQRRAEGHRALQPSVDELPDRRNHRRRSEGAGEAPGSRRRAAGRWATARCTSSTARTTRKSKSSRSSGEQESLGK